MTDQKQDTKEPKAAAAPKAEQLKQVTVRVNPERVRSKHAQFVEVQGGTATKRGKRVRIGFEPVKVAKTDFVNSLLRSGSITED